MPPAPRSLNVLFLQSQTYFGADSQVHGLVMRYLDRARVTVHAAVDPGTTEEASRALPALRRIEGLNVRPTYFGSSVRFRPWTEVAREVPAQTVSTIRSLISLARYARANGIQVVHCTEKPRDAFYGWMVARLCGACCVVHIHVGVDLRWISPLTRWAMRNADALIGVSRFVSATAVRAGFRASRIHTVHNALDPAEWDDSLDRMIVRRELGIDARTPVLASVSRLYRWKGQAELIRALAMLKSRGVEFRLLVVGEDDPRATPGSGSFTEELKSLSRSLGLADRVTFTGFRSDIPRIMAAADVYAMPSFEEPFGVVFLEAMAMRRPVVALDSGGVPEFVEHGRSGLLSVPGDIPQLSENLLTLIRDEGLRRRMGDHGRMQVEGPYHARRLAREVERVYEHVVAAAGSEDPPPA